MSDGDPSRSCSESKRPRGRSESPASTRGVSKNEPVFKPENPSEAGNGPLPESGGDDVPPRKRKLGIFGRSHAGDGDAGVAALAYPETEYIHGELDPDDGIDDNVNDTASPAFIADQRRRTASVPSPKEKARSNITVIAAIVAGVLTAAVKFLAAALSGSMAMFSEGIHSLVDASNDSLLLLGKKAGSRKPDIDHPFGYGRLVYFYSFVVALVIFIAGGGFTIYRGVAGVMAGGAALGDPWLDYIVLGVGVVIEGCSLVIATRQVNVARGDQGLLSYIRDSKDPSDFIVLLEDAAAVLGMVVAFAGIFLSHVLSMPVLDAWASVVIGAIMAVVALVLLEETYGLLVGEGVSRKELEETIYIVESDPAVIKCGRVLSLYLSPQELLLNLDVTFDDELNEGDVLCAVDRIEGELMKRFPETSRIFIEAESLNQVYRQRRERKRAFDEAALPN